MLTNEAFSRSVTAPELLLTIVLFCAVYLLLFVAWVRIVGKFVKAGPEATAGTGDDGIDVLPSVIDKIVGEPAVSAAGDAPSTSVADAVAEAQAAPEGGDA